MSAVHKLITDHLGIWTAADTEKKTGRGRASGNANSVYGIKKLRELILELAVRGKLVPQDQNDEPASELLKRIQAEKAKLVADGKIKKDKPQAAISENDKPFAAPSGWTWVRLSEVLLKITDGTHRSPINVSTGDFKYISAKNIKPWGIDLSDITYVTKDVHDEIFARCDPAFGDILYIKDGATTGIATINTLEEPFSMLSSVALLKPSIGTDNRFFLKAMTAPFFYAEMRSEMTGVAITRVTLAKLNYAIIPLPPLAEQRRIVAKVEELMALCDQLEAQHNNAADAHEQLVSHLLNTLTQSQDAADFNANWQRIATHFDTLFTTESSIDALKQTLLQLAVMGKLVPQDPNDEPASELLKRIQDEKAKLVAEGKIKKEKHSEAVSIGRPRFSIPSTWEWVPMSELCRPISSGSTPSAESFNFDDGVPFLKVYNIRDQEIDFEYKKQFISESLNVSKLSRSILYPGDVVMNIVGPPLGKVAIIPNTYPKWNCNQALVFFGLIKPISNKYILNYLKEGSFLKDIELIGTAGQDNISVTKSKNILVPLPPVEEQLRIVKKTDELLSVCAQLSLKIKLAQKISRIVADSISNKF